MPAPAAWPARAGWSARLPFRFAVRFVHPFPAAAPSCPRRWVAGSSGVQRPSVGGRPNPRSSEQRLAWAFSCIPHLSSPASVAELEFVRRLARSPLRLPLSPVTFLLPPVAPGIPRRHFRRPDCRFCALRSPFHRPGCHFCTLRSRFHALHSRFRRLRWHFHARLCHFRALRWRFRRWQRHFRALWSHFRSPPPNNALQRTEAGGRVFSVFRACFRQPPSLSLSSSGL